MLANKEQFEDILAKLGVDIAQARAELAQLLEKKELLKQIGEQEVLTALIELLKNSSQFVDKINVNYSKLKSYDNDLNTFKDNVMKLSDSVEASIDVLEEQSKKTEELINETTKSVREREKEILEMSKRIEKDKEFIKNKQKQLDDITILQKSREDRLKAVYNKLNNK